MAKKKTKKIEERVFTKEEVQAALEILHAEYFTQTLALLSYLPENQDLAFVKVPITTPDGGLYLVSIMHVDGPKVNLKKLSESAKVQQAENEA